MDLNVVEQIKESCDIKLIQSCCNKIIKKNIIKSGRDIENVSMLVRVLYVFDMYNEAVHVAELLKNCNFTGNYTVWVQIEIARAIETKILRSQGRNSDADNIFGTIIPYLNPSLYESQRDMLDSVYERNIQSVISNGTKSEVRDWKLVKLGLMILHSETPDFPIDKSKLNADILVLKKELKELIK